MNRTLFGYLFVAALTLSGCLMTGCSAQTKGGRFTIMEIRDIVPVSPRTPPSENRALYSFEHEEDGSVTQIFDAGAGWLWVGEYAADFFVGVKKGVTAFLGLFSGE